MIEACYGYTTGINDMDIRGLLEYSPNIRKGIIFVLGKSPAGSCRPGLYIYSSFLYSLAGDERKKPNKIRMHCYINNVIDQPVYRQHQLHQQPELNYMYEPFNP